MSIKGTIGRIRTVRAVNNDLWMEILQIAVEADPIRTSKVLEKIKNNDRQIMELTQELTDVAAPNP